MSAPKTLSFVEKKASATSSKSSNDSVELATVRKLSVVPRTSTGRKVALEGKFVELKRRRDDAVPKVSYQQRVTRMFHSINVNRPRQGIIVKPVLRFKPSYRLESNNPFDSSAVVELLQKIVETQMESRKNVFADHKAAIAMCRSLSEEILSQVKAKKYDRYRILVNVTAGEKYHQSFLQNALVLWDSDKDALANYVYERPDIFIITSVYGVYYD